MTKNTQKILKRLKEEKKMNKKLMLPITFFVLFIAPFVLAVDFNEEVNEEDRATFNEILTPVMKIYNLIKYGASALAGVMLVFSGIGYMTSGTDVKKRENAKSMATYVIVGLVVIWAAPLLVNLLVA